MANKNPSATHDLAKPSGLGLGAGLSLIGKSEIEQVEERLISECSFLSTLHSISISYPFHSFLWKLRAPLSPMSGLAILLAGPGCTIKTYHKKCTIKTYSFDLFSKVLESHS